MTKKFFGIAMLLPGIMAAVSCTDDKYDLDNIDTTTAIKVKDLVVPVNLETVTLDQVFDIDDDPDNIIIKYMNSEGKTVFAISKSGEFRSDDVFINEIVATDALVEPLSITLGGNGNGSFEINEALTSYYYHISDVDNTVASVSTLIMSEPMQISLSVSPAGGNVALENVVLSIPEGFEATYNGQEVTNGEVKVGSLSNGMLESPIYVTAINLGYNDPADGELSFDGPIGIKSATVTGNASSLEIQFSMSGFVVNEISGSIDYPVEAPSFEPVSLEDLPEFLKDGESNLILANPQIYMSFHNPVDAQIYSSLSILSERFENPSTEITGDLYPFHSNIILAADVNDLALESDYQGSVKQEMPQLQNILAGVGLPSYINFMLDDARLAGEIYNLKLGQGMAFYGNYSFFTPLSLEAGSMIYYTQTETDFFGDDVKDVNISKFQLTTYPTTNIPYDLELRISPLDKNGNVIKNSKGENIVARGFIDANANGTKALDLDINDAFNGLDGVTFSVVSNAQSNESLSPEQYIKLDNIRVKISGEYVTDF